MKHDSIPNIFNYMYSSIICIAGKGVEKSYINPSSVDAHRFQLMQWLRFRIRAIIFLEVSVNSFAPARSKHVYFNAPPSLLPRYIFSNDNVSSFFKSGG